MTKKQAELAAKIWIGDLIEAMADNVVDCESLRSHEVQESDLSKMAKAVFKQGAKIRGERPKRMTVKEIIEYVKTN